jgi:hypothetical protein
MPPPGVVTGVRVSPPPAPSDTTIVGIATAELTVATAPKATASIFKFFIILSFLLFFLVVA